MEDIALSRTLSKGTIYLYFESKEAVFRALLHETIAKRFSLLSDLARDHRGPVAPLLAEILRQLGHFIATSDLVVLPKMVIAEAGNFPDLARIYREEVAERGLSLFGGLLRIGIESGEFRKVPCSMQFGCASHRCSWPPSGARRSRPWMRNLRLCRPDRNAHRDAIARSSTRGARGMRPILALLLLVLLAACNPPPNTHWLGYVEGETALIAPPQPGWLTSIEVMRGAKVKVGDSLFTLDAIREIAARDNAAAAIAAAKEQAQQAAAQIAQAKRSRPPSKPTSRRPRKNSCASRNW